MKNTIVALFLFIATIPFTLLVLSLPEQVVGENKLLLVGGNVALIYFGIKYSRK
jgi:hypothetical protein